MDINIDFLRRFKQGQTKQAFEALSNQAGKGKEVWPGMLVLRKAVFSRKTMAVATCDMDWRGGCWMKNSKYSADVFSSYSSACVAGGDSKRFPM